jgi:hypothetical protein
MGRAGRLGIWVKIMLLVLASPVIARSPAAGRASRSINGNDNCRQLRAALRPL